MVLSEAPIPTKVPTIPCPRLKRPVPRVTSANNQRHQDAEHCGGYAVEQLHGHEQFWIRHRREEQAANGQRGEADKQHRATAPNLRTHPIHGDSAATTIWGTTIQAAIKIVARRAERIVTTWAINGSIARVGKMKEQEAAGKDQQRPVAHQDAGLERRIGALPRCCAMGTFGIDLRAGDLAQRQQSRHQQYDGDDEDGAGRDKITAGTHCRSGADPLPIEANRALRPSRSPIVA